MHLEVVARDSLSLLSRLTRKGCVINYQLPARLPACPGVVAFLVVSGIVVSWKQFGFFSLSLSLSISDISTVSA
jgi:hypothetical protein